MLLARPTSTMRYRPITSGRWIAAGVLCVAGLAGSAQTTSRLPPTAPTSTSNPNSLPAPIAATAPQGDTLQRHRARVVYANGMLEVHADNSSLNQILRDVSRETGMKIVGGVADQRVFGSYGPASAATVLQTLLDGTGANMLLQETPTHTPLQLVLTPRIGGPTPPPPGSASYDATEEEPEIPMPGTAQLPAPARNAAAPPSIAAAVAAPNATAAPATLPSMPQANNVYGNPNNVSPTVSTLPVTNSVPLSSLPTPSTAPPVSGIVDAPNPPPAGSTTAGFTSQTPPNNNGNAAPPATATQASPNGVKTPQQIYDELMQMRQKKANSQGSSAPQ